jgi:hypothetical protein
LTRFEWPQPDARGGNSKFTTSNESLRHRFLPLWHGLLRTGGAPDTLSAYRDMLLALIKTCIRKVSLPSNSKGICVRSLFYA